ncbi:MAG: deoxyribonuclease IV, partial [Sciscionella sp.]
FLSDPQSWDKPAVPSFAAELAASEVQVFIHSPYLINVASTNNRIRIPSRKAVIAQAEVAAAVGASGVVVHGGHVTAGDDPAQGVANWRKLFARQAEDGGFDVPILIENTAGGEHAMARKLDNLARLWDEVGEFGAGFVLDTCHAFAAGLELPDLVERVLAITGRIDLVHCNSSRDPFDSSRDRHANFATGTIVTEQLVELCRAAAAPVILETPDTGVEDDLAVLRAALRD